MRPLAVFDVNEKGHIPFKRAVAIILYKFFEIIHGVVSPIVKKEFQVTMTLYSKNQLKYVVLLLCRPLNCVDSYEAHNIGTFSCRHNKSSFFLVSRFCMYFNKYLNERELDMKSLAIRVFVILIDMESFCYEKSIC